MPAKWSKKAFQIKLKIDEMLLLSNSSEAFGLIKSLFWQIAKDPTDHSQDIRLHLQMTEQQMHGKH